jgi:hypothetical protein
MIFNGINGADDILMPAMLRHTTGVILLMGSITQFP